VELRHLRYFVAVAEAGSVSLAARRLNGTQPALSRQIRDLEQELGVRLFDRIGRKIVLTVDGDELLGHARRLLADAEAFRERAQALGGGESGVLRIGGTPQFIEAALPEVLARYRRARPGVEVRVIEDGAAPLVTRVRQGELHVAIGVLRAEGLQSRILYPLRVLAVMTPHHRLARRRSLTVSDLASERLLMLDRGFQTRDLFEEACRAAQVQPRVSIESRSPQSLVALAAGGHGIAILPSVVRLDRSRVAIAGMVHDGRPLGLWGRVVWDPDRYLPTYAAAFVETLARYTKASYPGHRLRLTRAVPRPAGA
jgi:DNA-binding transcriptional LysR family regulator